MRRPTGWVSCRKLPLLLHDVMLYTKTNQYSIITNGFCQYEVANSNGQEVWGLDQCPLEPRLAVAASEVNEHTALSLSYGQLTQLLLRQ